VETPVAAGVSIVIVVEAGVAALPVVVFVVPTAAADAVPSGVEPLYNVRLP